MTPLSPEWQLVLAGARSALGGPPPDVFPPPSPAPPDWSAVVEIGRQHRLAPLLYRGFRRLPASGVSAGALAGLKQDYLSNAARNAALFRSLERILGALSSAGTPVIVLKGAFLAESAYPERAVRPMNDIDILVPADRLEAARDALLGIGYEPEHDRDTREELKATHHHWVFASREASGAGIPLEVHWDLHPPWAPFRFDLAGVWARSVAFEIAGTRARVLGREDLLWHLITHAARHRFNLGAITLCDLAAVILRYGETGMNWEAFALQAAESHSAAWAAAALDLAAELLGVPVPDEALRSLRGGKANGSSSRRSGSGSSKTGDPSGPRPSSGCGGADGGGAREPLP